LTILLHRLHLLILVIILFSFRYWLNSDFSQPTLDAIGPPLPRGRAAFFKTRLLPKFDGLSLCSDKFVHVLADAARTHKRVFRELAHFNFGLARSAFTFHGSAPFIVWFFCFH
jgi:hypothetical protein